MVYMKKTIVLLLTLLIFLTGIQAQNITVSGTISDSATGEQLIQATIFDELNKRGTTSNEYGFYSLTLPQGEVQLSFSYVGYQPDKHTFKLQTDTTLNIILS